MGNIWKKYRWWIIITISFVMLITFFVPSSLIRTYRLKRNIRELRKEQEFYRSESSRDSIFIEKLKDDDFLEKFARENFYMKRDGEEVYIIEIKDK